MTRRLVQLRLSRPAKKVRMGRLTERQRALLALLRAEPMEVGRIHDLMGYSWPAAACERLVARGLATRVAPGVYRARVVRERKP